MDQEDEVMYLQSASGQIQHSSRSCVCRRWTMAKTAATVATLVTTASAFQSGSHFASSRSLSSSPPSSFSRRPLRQIGSTRRWTVTDPDLLLMETSRSRIRPSNQETALSESLESLESLYITSESFNELVADEQVVSAMAARRSPSRSSNKINMKVSTLPARKKKQPPKVAAQKRFSIETTPTATRKQNLGQKSSIPVESKIVETGNPKTQKKTATVVATEAGGDKKKRKSRSSTMPGLNSRHLTGRQKAFADGIKMAEKRSGKKLTNLVNDSEAKKKRKKASGEAMYKSSASVPDSLVQFANEIHNVERITPSEEVELGTKTQEAIRLQSLFDNLAEKLNREPTDDEWCAAAGKINMETIRQTIEDGLEAKNKLVTSNLRMVQGVVNVYIRNGLGGEYNAGDMMQEGIIALMRAAEKFEPQRGFRFSTYAMYWIRAAVKRSHIFQSRIVNVPQRLYDNHKRVMRAKKELRTTLGREPSTKELCDAVGMSEQQLERCTTAMDQRVVSLDQRVSNTRQPNNDDSESSMNDIVDSKFDDGEYNKLQRLFMREDLIETLYRHLAPNEVDMLLLRFGLMDERTAPHGFSGPLTIAEVSSLVGLKPDKCRRMINSSLKQLKYVIANEWDDFEKELELL